MTETNRFMMKKVTMKMYSTKSRLTKGEFFSTGCLSRPTASIAANIISGHISKVEISKKVFIEIKMWSHLLNGWFHSLSANSA